MLMMVKKLSSIAVNVGLFYCQVKKGGVIGRQTDLETTSLKLKTSFKLSGKVQIVWEVGKDESKGKKRTS
jgi:hypothetical protein